MQIRSLRSSLPLLASFAIPGTDRRRNQALLTNSFFSHRHAADEKFKDVFFCKIDVDVLQDLSKELSIRRMPTFILFKDGSRIDDVFEPKPPQLDTFLAQAL